MNAEEIAGMADNRRVVYGKDRTLSRLQRFFEVSELSKRRISIETPHEINAFD